jgi:hypothetical protein
MVTLAAFHWLALADGLHPSYLNRHSLLSVLQHYYFSFTLLHPCDAPNYFNLPFFPNFNSTRPALLAQADQAPRRLVGHVFCRIASS